MIGIGQTTIYNETFGTPTATTAVATYATGTAPATFSSKGTVTFTASTTSPDCRTTTASSGYAGASGSGNMYFTTNSTIYCAISGINTSGYTSIGFTLGLYHSTATALTQSGFAIEYCTDYNTSTNTGTFTAMSFTTGTTAAWALITPTGTLPASSSLTIRFSQKQTSQQVRLDDITITGTAAATPTLTGTATATAFTTTYGLSLIHI